MDISAHRGGATGHFAKIKPSVEDIKAIWSNVRAGKHNCSAATRYLFLLLICFSSTVCQPKLWHTFLFLFSRELWLNCCRPRGIGSAHYVGIMWTACETDKH